MDKRESETKTVLIHHGLGIRFHSNIITSKLNVLYNQTVQFGSDNSAKEDAARFL